MHGATSKLKVPLCLACNIMLDKSTVRRKQLTELHTDTNQVMLDVATVRHDML